jgi:FkbM family methyltransferase
MTNYSQNDEQALITAYFGSQIGRFLDIGAYDGVRLSNSRALLEQGWTGTLVEPSPIVFTQLMANTVDYADKVTLVNAAITTSESEPVAFYDSMGDAISTTDTQHLVKWKSHPNWRSFFVMPIRAQQFCMKFGFDYDFVSIDVEGQNYNLLRSLPLANFDKLRMICIEYDDKAPQITEWITGLGMGFILVHRNAENLIFAK